MQLIQICEGQGPGRWCWSQSNILPQQPLLTFLVVSQTHHKQMLTKSWPRLWWCKLALAYGLWHALNVANPFQINFSRHMTQCLQGCKRGAGLWKRRLVTLIDIIITFDPIIPSKLVRFWSIWTHVFLESNHIYSKNSYPIQGPSPWKIWLTLLLLQLLYM